MAQRLQKRESCVVAYQEAYRGYCWPVNGLTGMKLAPFQLLAAEGRTLLDRDHLGHMQTLARLATVSERFIATEHPVLETNRSESVKVRGEWWDKKQRRVWKELLSRFANLSRFKMVSRPCVSSLL
ncbi:hypothetical protein [Armatimonas sp.]|uniref:hypothetical protein n=1 Tax=Armatimonas sp. TaxID=1872638 RepID=UPI003753625D